MKHSRTLRILSALLLVCMLSALLIACRNQGDDPIVTDPSTQTDETTASPTDAPTEDSEQETDAPTPLCPTWS